MRKISFTRKKQQFTNKKLCQTLLCGTSCFVVVKTWTTIEQDKSKLEAKEMKIWKKYGGLAGQKLKSYLNVIKSNKGKNILLNIERGKSGETSFVYVKPVFEGKRINGHKERGGTPKKRCV